MRFRFATAEDMPQVEALWDYCFEKREEAFFQYYFSQYNGKENKVYGAFLETEEGEKLQSMVHLNPYTVRINGQWVEIPYLVGVATAEEARGHHLMGEMLQHLWQEPEMAQLPFVFLMPINAGIYLPYDFAFTHYRHEYKLPLKALEELGAGEGIIVEEQEIGGASEAILAPMYQALTAKYNGVNRRDTKQWQKLITVCLQEEMQLAVAKQEDKPVGYMLYHKGEGALEVFELLNENAKVRNALLKHLAGVAEAMSLEQIHWLASQEDKTYLDFKNQNSTGGLAPFMMFRIGNMEKALELALKKNAALETGELLFQLSDSLISQNNGSFWLSVHSDKLFLEPLSIEEKAIVTSSAKLVKLSIGTFTQLLMGTFTAQELEEAGKVECSSQESLALLDNWFSKHRNWINEYF